LKFDSFVQPFIFLLLLFLPLRIYLHAMSPINIFPDSIHFNSMKSFNSEKSLYLALSSHTIEDGEQPYKDDPLANLKKLETNLYGEDGYEDDVFKLPTDNLPKGIVVKRLKDIL